MAHYGTLRDYRFSEEEIDDIRGSDIYGINDEKLGDIDDLIFDHNTGGIRYAVVKSGWISGKKFIVPADRLRPSANHDDDYEVDLTKQQIEQFPPYEESSVADSDRWQKYERDYDKVLTTDGGVMHRTDSPDRIITPPPSEVVASTTTSARAADLRSDTRTTAPEQNIPVPTPEYARTPRGERWDRFEDRLRRDRTHIVSSCNVCRVAPQSSSTVERDRERKVS
jgi:sporulation protein YlmC with PRC-barrel domain